MSTTPTAEPAQPVADDPRSSLDRVRASYREFVDRHELGWELLMAGLAVVFVAIPFLADLSPGPNPSLEILDWVLTGLFFAEFASRLWASEDRIDYASDHWIDAVALVPVLRGLRVARLLRLGRLVRTFVGIHRASRRVDRLRPYRTLANLVVAWVGTMVLCSIAFFQAESGVNPRVVDFGSALWWGVTTIAGAPNPIVAVTDDGRIATAILLIVGVALFAAITAGILAILTGRTRDVATRLDLLTELRDQGDLTPERFDALLRAELRRD